MKRRLVTITFVVAAIGLDGAFAFAHNVHTAPVGQSLAPFEFKPEAATSPETASQAMFRGVATASPRKFGKHMLLGVCNNEVDGLNRYAESLHLTQFSSSDEALTFYDLSRSSGQLGQVTTDSL